MCELCDDMVTIRMVNGKPQLVGHHHVHDASAGDAPPAHAEAEDRGDGPATVLHPRG